MEEILYINEKDLSSSEISKTFSSVKILRSVEDVATLLEVFENVLLEVSVDNIKDVLSDVNGNYVFLVSDEKCKFDLYPYINQKYHGDVVVSCINAKLLFPKSRSRGIYSYVERVIDDEEIPTGFLGDDDIDELTQNTKYFVYYPKTGESAEITFNGILVGRSSAQSDFVIKGNANLSRKHCKIYKYGSDIIVEDLNSSNGTFVNNRKLKGEKATIGVGESIYIAGEELVIQ